MWLSLDQTQDLERELLRQWQEQQDPPAPLSSGSPIIYSWILWLKSYCLPHIRATQQLLLLGPKVRGPCTRGVQHAGSCSFC